MWHYGLGLLITLQLRALAGPSVGGHFLAGTHSTLSIATPTRSPGAARGLVDCVAVGIALQSAQNAAGAPRRVRGERSTDYSAVTRP